MAGSLRSFRDADRAAVLELSRRALTRPEEQLGNPVWETMDELASELAGWDRAPEETLFVIEEDDAVSGFGGVEVAAGWEHADLFGPLVSPAFRGQRVGSRLLDASVERARESGARKVVASVGTRNAGGRMLLETAGFRALGGAQALYRLSPGAHRPFETRPEGVEVRRGGPADLGRTLELYRECFPTGEFPEQVWRAGLERGSLYLAVEHDRAVAFVDIDPSDRWAYHLGVTGTERARGIGAYLLTRALTDYWSEHPGETLGLSVNADNVPAIRLYRRQGFAPWLVLQILQLEL